MRAKYLVIGVALGVLLSSAVVVLAGNLDPSSGPTDAASQMYTLEDIYDRLNGGTADSKMTSFTEPASGPGTGTMHTLDDIMGIAPAADNTDGAVSSHVLSGKTYWGLSSTRRGAWGTQTGTRVPAPVPETGQTDCYKSESIGICACGTADCPSGQDGDLEKGVAWPNPRFTDNGDGTVTDNLTGLIWLKKANCPNATRKWATALYDVMQLNADGTMNGHDCGDTSKMGLHQTDWRLPNVRELFSLIDPGWWNPALPSGYSTFFTGVQTNYYWSSSTYAADTSYAWLVSLGDGAVRNATKTPAYYVWPVRGGQ